MVAKVTWGHGVLNASVRAQRGRLAAVGGDYWSNNASPSTSGYDGTYGVGSTIFRADSDRTVGAILAWLAGAGSLSILVQANHSVPGYSFGTLFTDGLTRLGHTFTLTGLASNLNGYDPLDFDVYAVTGLGSQVYRGVYRSEAQIIDYIIENGGAILADDQSQYSRYGWTASIQHDYVNSGIHQEHFSGGTLGAYGPGVDLTHGWQYQRPFVSTSLGDPGVGGSWATNYYALVTYSSYYLIPSTNTMGGTSEIVDCALANASHPRSKILGLWSD